MSQLKLLIESRESSTVTRGENFLAKQNKILEIHERELRRNNVIVVGLKEEPEKPTVDNVSKLFNEMKSNVLEELRRELQDPFWSGSRNVAPRLV